MGEGTEAQEARVHWGRARISTQAASRLQRVCYFLGNSARLAPRAPGQGQAQAQRCHWKGNRGEIMKDN